MKLLRSITTLFLVMVTFTGTSLLWDASAAATTVAARAAASVTAPLDVTRDRFANNEESLGMSPDGSLLAGSWNDWEFSPDGSVYVTWVNGPNETSLNNNAVMAAMSTDGGNTWSGSFTVAPIVAPIPGQLPNSKYRVFTDAWSTVDQASGKLVVGYTDEKSGAANVYAVHTLRPGDLSSWSAPVRVKASANQQFFPWLSSAPGGRVDLVFYDRACDPADTRNCVTLASTSDSGQTWDITPLTSRGFDGDRFQACLAFVEPPDCGSFFLGDYIAVASTDGVAQVLWTGNGPAAMDVFSQRVSF